MLATKSCPLLFSICFFFFNCGSNSLRIASHRIASIAHARMLQYSYNPIFLQNSHPCSIHSQGAGCFIETKQTNPKTRHCGVGLSKIKEDERRRGGGKKKSKTVISKVRH
ncbi:hypothetical protein HOY80DRAFT_961030, partial [Tuber brumale]